MDLEKELNKALSDPNIMDKVKGVLASMGDGDTNNSEGDAGGVLSALSGSAGDDRTRLLMAIKPFLSEKRAPYMDSALMIMKLAKMGKIGKDLKLF